ncbi:MAG: hypothetical protein J0I34_07235 [Pseudonocardia sp.]|uniref:hypothetical protein n=1 Tax=Actinomycetes TaxID=1760 RepID=UPI00086A216A|nr:MULTISPECIES: hypothetical protein [Actinomycetes]MBN9108560.1 hypothetical protein [Pseudonocardia sp.]ODU27440.1 MAG: hypothetical protein ABS80_03425 [Pseudonocardia sp. SCN 72-51]ODV07798.1 MAG: hypothetical protein ABT15_06895 [Pseudonocardia sp. SCN 73-27]
MSDDLDYEVLVAYTRTGQVVDGIDQPDWSFEENLAWASPGKLSLTVPLPGLDRAGQILRSTLRGIASAGCGVSLVLMRGDDALWAGPVATLEWTDTSVSVGCSTIGKLLDRRVVVADGYWADPTNPAADLTVALPPRDLVIELLTRAISGSRRDLPIVLPAQSGNSGDPVTYKGVDLRTTFEAVKAVVEADGGPDVLMQPQMSADKSQLSWGAAIGTPDLGGLNSDAVWDYPLTTLSGDVDDSETVSTAYVTGDAAGGASTARPIGVATFDRGDPWPALERADRTSTSETRKSQLDALAASYGEEYRWPVEAVTLGAPTDLLPLYRTTWQLGDTGTFPFTGHPWLDDGEISARIVGVSVDPDTTSFTTKES